MKKVWNRTKSLQGLQHSLSLLNLQGVKTTPNQWEHMHSTRLSTVHFISHWRIKTELKTFFKWHQILLNSCGAETVLSIGHRVGEEMLCQVTSICKQKLEVFFFQIRNQCTERQTNLFHKRNCSRAGKQTNLVISHAASHPRRHVPLNSVHCACLLLAHRNSIALFLRIFHDFYYFSHVDKNGSIYLCVFQNMPQDQ